MPLTEVLAKKIVEKVRQLFTETDAEYFVGASKEYTDLKAVLVEIDAPDKRDMLFESSVLHEHIDKHAEDLQKQIDELFQRDRANVDTRVANWINLDARVVKLEKANTCSQCGK